MTGLLTGPPLESTRAADAASLAPATDAGARSRVPGFQAPALPATLLLALAYHGALLMAGTYRRTFDAYVHMFFADHYFHAWFDHWNYGWYTGFPMVSYPPASHQTIAALTPLTGLMTAYVIVQLAVLLLFVVGVYRFARLWVDEESARWAAVLGVLATSVGQTVHVFGQLPTMFGLGFLLNALPFVRQWLEGGNWRVWLTACAVLAATTAGHHVTTLFGAVFFVGAVVLRAAVDRLEQREGGIRAAWRQPAAWRPLIGVGLRAGALGLGVGVAALVILLPYWYWSITDPITQVSIPHASRASYLVDQAAGLMFWVLPYGLFIFGVPYALWRAFRTRAWPLGLVFVALFVLGTGGTTPIPRLVLGKTAFEILTFERFTFWATIILLPLLGAGITSLRGGGLAYVIRTQLGKPAWLAAQAFLGVALLVASAVVANWTQVQRLQPEAIETLPIVNFLAKDEHWRWRYITLGFGDQMAWLSIQSPATSIDGNYHSARRLPEMTTTAVERIDGAKFQGASGLFSLAQFLAMPEKYHFKYVFSYDQFYDPMLFAYGWHRVGRLENGIFVWEREDVPPLPAILPRREIPIYQRIMWGLAPPAAVLGALLALTSRWWSPAVARLWTTIRAPDRARRPQAVRPAEPGRLERAWRSALRWARCRWRPPRVSLRLPRLGAAAASKTAGAPPSPRAFTLAPEDAAVPVHQPWYARLPPATPLQRAARVVALVGIAGVLLTVALVLRARQADSPQAIVRAYFQDLDFRYFDRAYARLDPYSRPSFDQYRLELSLTGGLVATYGKLLELNLEPRSREANYLQLEASGTWLTGVGQYQASELLTLVRRDGTWYIVPAPSDLSLPPDTFFRRPAVDWHAQGRRRPSVGPTPHADVLDRPPLRILNARLIEANGICRVVGELVNVSTDPGDITVTAVLEGPSGREITRANAATAVLHKLLPKEVTPFRVDFVGVAGAPLRDGCEGDAPVLSFQVQARAVVTGRDLGRDVAAQHLTVNTGDGVRLEGQLLNSGVQTATVPHIVLTFYDDDDQVAWVEEAFLRTAIRPQRGESFSLPIPGPNDLRPLFVPSVLVAHALPGDVPSSGMWPERVPLPPGLGFASVRASINYYTVDEP